MVGLPLSPIYRCKKDLQMYQKRVATTLNLVRAFINNKRDKRQMMITKSCCPSCVISPKKRGEQTAEWVIHASATDSWITDCDIELESTTTKGRNTSKRGVSSLDRNTKNVGRGKMISHAVVMKRREGNDGWKRRRGEEFERIEVIITLFSSLKSF